MSLRDLCDVAYVLRGEQAERDLLAVGGGDLEALRRALDDELVADAPEQQHGGTERARLLQATLTDLLSA